MMVEFDWDDANVNHIARHGVTPEEAEEALLDPHRVIISVRSVENERRWTAVGGTQSGRVLVVVITRRWGFVRVVTARDALPREKRRYRRAGRSVGKECLRDDGGSSRPFIAWPRFRSSTAKLKRRISGLAIVSGQSCCARWPRLRKACCLLRASALSPAGRASARGCRPGSARHDRSPPAANREADTRLCHAATYARERDHRLSHGAHGAPVALREVKSVLLTGGRVARRVQRLDAVFEIGGRGTSRQSFVQKHTHANEVAVMRLLRPIALRHAVPRLVADGRDADGLRLLIPLIDGKQLDTRRLTADVVATLSAAGA